MKKKVLFLGIVSFLVSTYLLFGQSSWKEVVDKLPLYKAPIKFDSIVYSARGIEINYKVFNEQFRKRGKEAFVWVGTKKEWASGCGEVDEGSGSYDIELPNGKYETKPYFNKYTFYGKMQLLPSYITLVFKEQYLDMTLFHLLNYNSQQELLSSVKILETESGPFRSNVAYQKIPFNVRAKVNDKNIVEISGAADFKFSSKYKLDSDGHFRAISSEVEYYEDKK